MPIDNKINIFSAEQRIGKQIYVFNEQNNSPTSKVNLDYFKYLSVLGKTPQNFSQQREKHYDDFIFKKMFCGDLRKWELDRVRSGG